MTLRIRFFSALGGVLIFVALLLFAPAAARSQDSECGSVDALIEVTTKAGLQYRVVGGPAVQKLRRMVQDRTGADIQADRALVAKVRGGFVVAFISGAVSCGGFMAGFETPEGAEISDVIFGRAI